MDEVIENGNGPAVIGATHTLSKEQPTFEFFPSVKMQQ